MLDLVGDVLAHSLVKILMIVSLVCCLTNLRVPLGFALLVGAFLVGVSFDMAPGAVAVEFGRSAVAPATIELALLVGLILTLSHLLSSAGQMRRMVTALGAVVRNTKARLAILPGLIGLLPMPGGALFSAPMVKEASNGSDYEAHHITAINHWFRHVWEYCWPLYPGLLLVPSLIEGEPLSVLQYAAIQSPLTVAALVAGFIFVFGHVKPPPAPAITDQPLSRRGWELAASVSPILVIIASLVLLSLAAKYAPANVRSATAGLYERVPFKSWALLGGLAVAIVYVLLTNDISPGRELKKVLRTKQLWLLVLMVFGIKIFAGLIEGTNAAGQVRDWLQQQNVPLLAIAAALPFFVGLITGITVGFVGVAFPLLLKLLSDMSLPHQLSYMVFAYAWGFTGVLISPVHVCLVVTSEYFKTDLTKTYRWLLPASAVVILAATAMHLVLRYGWA